MRPTLLSAALTRISSKILKNPGTKVVFLASAGVFDVDVLLGHHFGLAVKDPHLLSDGLDRSDIGVGPFEDVFELRELFGTVSKNPPGQRGESTFWYVSVAVFAFPFGTFSSASAVTEGPATEGALGGREAMSSSSASDIESLGVRLAPRGALGFFATLVCYRQRPSRRSDEPLALPLKELSSWEEQALVL